MQVTASIFGLLALAATVSAHIRLAMPAPFPGGSQSPLNGEPALPICQGITTGGTQTTLKLGSLNNPLTFLGTAVHKGGSCQVSITYKKKPTATDFRVITSFHGGCPMDYPAGNIQPGDANKPLDSGLTFDVPKDIPGGDAILAWSWTNLEGNREFYMMCAPIKLTGSGGNKANFEKLPNMVTPNMPGDCRAEANVDYKYEHPGPVVRIGHKRELKVLKGCKGSPGAGGKPVTTEPEPKPVEGKPTTPADPAPPANPAPPADPAPPATPVPPAHDPVPAPGAGGVPGAGDGPTGACTSGTFNCVGGKSFSQCSNGKWAAAISMAQGTQCTPGVHSTLTLTAVAPAAKRSFVIPRQHVRDFGVMETTY